MKNVRILVFLIFCSFSVAQAQTEKGRWTVGAQVGTLTFQRKSNFKSFAASLRPSAGYFVTNGLVLGMGIPLTINNQKTDYDNYHYNHFSTKAIGLAPFVRYFLGRSQWKPYVGLSYSYQKISGTIKNDDTIGLYEGTIKGHTTALVPSLGIACFVNRSLALTLEADYTINQQKQHTDYTTLFASSNSDIDTRSLSLAIGFQLFLGK